MVVPEAADEMRVSGGVVSHDVIVTLTVPVLERSHPVSVTEYVNVSIPQNVAFAV
jgi:hypothetical protein